MDHKTLLFAVFAIFFTARALSTRPRILNGYLAHPGQFPYQVSLFNNGVHECGGVIIKEQYVLTAAHCFESTLLAPDRHQVIAGTVDLSKIFETNGSVHNVTKIILHEDYSPSDSWNNDIALLKVVPPFVYTKNVAPAKLPRKNEEIELGQVVRVSGFGRIEKGGSLSNRLLNTYVDIISLERCQEVYDIGPKILRTTNICTQNIDYETGFCSGDSGGPLSISQKVIGIVSYSINEGCACSEAKVPQILTRVDSYLDWIAEHTEEQPIEPMDADIDMLETSTVEAMDTCEGLK